MKGGTHIALSLTTLMVILAPLTPILWDIGINVIPYLILVILGVFFGSITPDVDTGKNSAIFHSAVPGAKGKRFFLTPVFGYFICYTVYYPVRAFFVLIFGKKIYAKEGHRELPHSPLGCLCMTILLTAYIWLACFGLSFIPGLSVLFNNFGIYLFGMSFFLGCLLHLIEDSCDYAGIHWFYPFSFTRMRGKLQGNGHEVRPRIYMALNIAVALILYTFALLGFLSSTIEICAAIAVPVFLWALYMLLSGCPSRKVKRELI